MHSTRRNAWTMIGRFCGRFQDNRQALTDAAGATLMLAGLMEPSSESSDLRLLRNLPKNQSSSYRRSERSIEERVGIDLVMDEGADDSGWDSGRIPVRRHIGGRGDGFPPSLDFCGGLEFPAIREKGLDGRTRRCGSAGEAGDGQAKERRGCDGIGGFHFQTRLIRACPARATTETAFSLVDGAEHKLRRAVVNLNLPERRRLH